MYKTLPSYQVSSFSNVDKASEPQEWVNYLKYVNTQESIKNYKSWFHSLLCVQNYSRILDIGCGTGEDTFAISCKLKGKSKIIGIDYSKIMVAFAQKYAQSSSRIKYVHGDVNNLKFEQKIFDLCLADRVFQHLKTPHKALQELIRVTQPGGKIAIIDPDWSTLSINNSSDLALSQRILAHQSNFIQNPSIAKELLSLFESYELQNTQIFSYTLLFYSYTVANIILSLTKAADRAEKAQLISKEDKVNWLRELNELDQEGNFTSSLGMYCIIGNKSL
ncbi:MAG: methyltransferase domain-containing protein [Alphaproteobacteria bacterium]|nr:methyltransferase domain-containing protein [Alphaproteobacteria bacterium]